MLMLCHPGCLDGFMGRNCNVQCPSPSYGQDCQQECKCQPNDCHHVFGCRLPESGKRNKINKQVYIVSKIKSSNHVE